MHKKEDLPYTYVTATPTSNDQVLSAQELRVIKNMRIMKPVARQMILDVSTEYARTLPVSRPELRLVDPLD